MLALVAAGCDASGDDDGAGSGSANATREVTTTRVEVVEGIGREGGFNPAEIYSQLSPGVVTVISLFDGGTSSSDTTPTPTWRCSRSNRRGSI